MSFHSDRHHRRSIRLPDYDYTQCGAYFVTLCTYQRQCLFGEIVGHTMQLNDYGNIAADCWRSIPAHFRHIVLDAWVVMPNHVHGIIVIEVVAQHAAPTTEPPAPARCALRITPTQGNARLAGYNRAIL